MKFFFITFVVSIFVFISLPAFAKSKDLEDDQICRAAISAIFDEKVEDVEVFRSQLNVTYVRFPKSKDNKVTRFKCIIQGADIIWATETGAYRNTGIDSKISYEIKENVLTIKEDHKNGSIFKKAFDIKKLVAK